MQTYQFNPKDRSIFQILLNPGITEFLSQGLKEIIKNGNPVREVLSVKNKLTEAITFRLNNRFH